MLIYHSDGIQMYLVEDGQIIGNLFYGIQSTSAIFFISVTNGAGAAEYSKRVKFLNNIIYTPDVGLVMYIKDAIDIELYNNIFWGVRNGNSFFFCSTIQQNSCIWRSITRTQSQWTQNVQQHYTFHKFESHGNRL